MSSSTIDLTQSPHRPLKRRRHSKKKADEVEADEDGVTITRIVRRRTSRLRAETIGVDHGTYRRMRLLGLPFALFNILWWLYACSGASSDPSLHHIEWFAGVGTIHRAVTALGYASVQCDVLHNALCHNFITKEGILHSCQLLRRLIVGGGNHYATVCSSWVFLNRSSSERFDVCPLGFPPQPRYVLDANAMVSIMALFWTWCIAAKTCTVLEQPLSSLMARHPRLVSSSQAITVIAASYGGSQQEQDDRSVEPGVNLSQLSQLSGSDYDYPTGCDCERQY